MKAELLPGGIRLLQSDKHLKLGADAILLAAFCPKAERICELGCGVGNVLLALAGRQPAATLTGVELNPDAAALCRESIALNALEGRVEVLTADLRELRVGGGTPTRLGACAEAADATLLFDLVVMNPPYLRAGTVRESPDAARNLERVDRTASPRDVASAAARLLREGGTLCLVLRADRVDDYLAALADASLEPLELRLVAHTPSHAPSLALVRAEKVLAPSDAAVTRNTLYLANPDGSPGAEYARILAGGTL